MISRTKMRSPSCNHAQSPISSSAANLASRSLPTTRESNSPASFSSVTIIFMSVIPSLLDLVGASVAVGIFRLDADFAAAALTGLEARCLLGLVVEGAHVGVVHVMPVAVIVVVIVAHVLWSLWVGVVS